MPAYRARTATRRDGDAGFSMVEVLVALGIISTVMAATTPFAVSALNIVAQQSSRQGAIQLANDAVERTRALAGSALLSGRGKRSVQDQWNAAPAAAKPLLQVTTPYWDDKAGDDAGAQAPLPTLPQTVRLDRFVYLRNWYVGRCWQPTAKRHSPAQPDPALNVTCARKNNPKSTDVPFFRVVVTIGWTHSACRSSQCTYVTSTLISAAADDPVFAIKRPPPKISDPGTVVVYRGDPASRQLSALGGVLPLRWTAGGLPANLALTTGGVLTGTPTTIGSTTVTLSVMDQESYTDTRNVTVAVVEPLTVPTPGPQVSRVGTAASFPVPASGGLPPLVWTAADLPAGLTVDPDTGVVSGTPTTVASRPATITVTDGNGTAKAVTFDWRVLTPVALADPGAQSTRMNGTARLALAATGGEQPYRWRSDDLPYGLSIDAGTGVVSGTVTRGTRHLSTVWVTDNAGMQVSTTFVYAVPAATELDLAVTAPAPAAPDQAGTVGTAVSVSAAASNAPLGVNTWTAANLPPGLSISAAGLGGATISGRPTARGTYRVQLTVRDATGRYAHETFTWTVR